MILNKVLIIDFFLNLIMAKTQALNQILRLSSLDTVFYFDS